MPNAPDDMPLPKRLTVAERKKYAEEALPQVQLIARRIHQRLPAHVPLDDLIQIGAVGLMKALKDFDPSMGVQINTYAEHKIRGAILDDLRKRDYLPRWQRKRFKEADAEYYQGKQKLNGEAPSLAEIIDVLAKEKRMPKETKASLMDAARNAHLHGGAFVHIEHTQKDTESEMDNRLLPPTQPVAEDNIYRQEVLKLIEGLPPRQRAIIEARYLGEKKLREVADEQGLKIANTARIEREARQELRELLSSVRANDWTQQSARSPSLEEALKPIRLRAQRERLEDAFDRGNAKLTDPERDALRMLLSGKGYAQTARDLGSSPGTIHTACQRALRKLPPDVQKEISCILGNSWRSR